MGGAECFSEVIVIFGALVCVADDEAEGSTRGAALK